MKKMLNGFAIGVAFTCLCGFSMCYSCSSSRVSTYASTDVKDNFQQVLDNQYIIARMLETASCR